MSGVSDRQIYREIAALDKQLSDLQQENAELSRQVAALRDALRKVSMCANCWEVNAHVKSVLDNTDSAANEYKTKLTASLEAPGREGCDL